MGRGGIVPFRPPRRASRKQVATLRFPDATQFIRHCEQSEAIQNLPADAVWIASARTRLAMTRRGHGVDKIFASAGTMTKARLY
jgi:hypothetical protein